MNAFNVFILFIFYWTSLAGPIRRTPKNAFGKRHQLNNDDTKWSDEEPVASNHRKFYISNYHKRPLRSVRHSDDYEDKNVCENIPRKNALTGTDDGSRRRNTTFVRCPILYK